MTSPLASVELHFVDTLDDVLAMYEWAGQERDTPVACDTEGEGINPVTDRLRLIQLGDTKQGWAVPIEWAGAVIELLKKIFGRNEHVVFHHSCFDIRVIKHSLGYQIPWHLADDTLILAALADPTRPKGLKPLASRLIDKNATAGQKLLDDGMKAHGWTWKTVPKNFPPYAFYAAADPVLTAMIYRELYERVSRESPQAYDLERAVTPVLASMMDIGLNVDQPYAKEKLAELRSYITSARDWLSSTHGISSLMSARQIAVALGEVGAPITTYTPTGLPSVSKEALRYISLSGDFSKEANDLASTILKARHSEKLAGTYLENFISLSTSSGDGALHPSINQLSARTGRMSCGGDGINLQNLPRDDKIVRGCIIPRPGHAFVACDFSQVEMRIFASISEDPGLIEAFKNADATGIDFYAVLATELFGEPVEKKSPKRQNVKSASYARIFGAGLAKMAQTAGVTPEQMKPVNDALGQRYPGMNSLPGRLIHEARAMQMRGEIPHVRTSTGRFLPADADRLFSLTNYLVQGSAAEQLKRAIINIASAGLTEYARLPIHDEVLFEVPLERASEMKDIIMDTMTDNQSYAVPITCDASIMTERWSKQ